MSNEALATQETARTIERVLVGGDLSQLKPDDRLAYYKMVCESVGLNPLTKPLEYIVLNGKLTLYARKDATDQLRNVNKISVTIQAREVVDECYVVTARATTPEGRTDESIGAVSMANLKGDAKCNGMMKAETKAKRRVTLSICGLGMLDETEIETIPSARAPSDSPVTTAPVTFTRSAAGNKPSGGAESKGPALSQAAESRVAIYEALIESQRDGGSKPESVPLPTAEVVTDSAPASDTITLGQRRALHREFRDALPEHLQKDVETLLGSWLVVSGFYETIGQPPNQVRKGTRKNIEAHLFEETKRRAVLYASKCI